MEYEDETKGSYTFVLPKANGETAKEHYRLRSRVRTTTFRP